VALRLSVLRRHRGNGQQPVSGGTRRHAPASKRCSGVRLPASNVRHLPARPRDLPVVPRRCGFGRSQHFAVPLGVWAARQRLTFRDPSTPAASQFVRRRCALGKNNHFAVSRALERVCQRLTRSFGLHGVGSLRGEPRRGVTSAVATGPGRSLRGPDCAALRLVHARFKALSE